VIPKKVLTLRGASTVSNAEENSVTCLTGFSSDRTCHYLREDFNISVSVSHTFVVDSILSNAEKCGLLRYYFTSNKKTLRSMSLCDGSRKILTVPNAGGTSEVSEALSFEFLSFVFRAKLVQTEMELKYWPQGCKITDYSVVVPTVHGEVKLGVSVTRALKFKGTFTEEDATHLLKKKLDGVNVSTRCVVSDRWERQILFCWCKEDYIAELVGKVWEKLDAEYKSNTLVVLAVSKNAEWIF